jgi:hypothetical protein
MKTNWISRVLTAARRFWRFFDGFGQSSPQLGRSDDPWSVDTDRLRMRHELDAVRSRFEGQSA